MKSLRMQPVFKERVWGGRRLADLFGKNLPAGKRIGESWEVADHPHGRSRVAEGPYAGMSLSEVLADHASEVLGSGQTAPGVPIRFPLLVKFLDVADRLSVQVHPNDAQAACRCPGECGKTECWVVVEFAPGGWVVQGLQAGVTRQAFSDALRAGTVTDLLLYREVKAGDVVWTPPGLVHEAGGGVVLAEVQQASDLTYRVYDWDRGGLDGRRRKLHVQEALETISFGVGAPSPGGQGYTAAEDGLVVEHLVDCEAFSLSRLAIDGCSWTGRTHGAYAIVVVLAGGGRLVTWEADMPLRAGDAVLVPATEAEYELRDASGLTSLIVAPSGKAPRT